MAEMDKDPKEYLVGKNMDRQMIRVTSKALDSLPPDRQTTMSVHRYLIGTQWSL